jgi:hypothetical protein
MVCAALVLALAAVPMGLSGQDKKKDRDEILAKMMQRKLASAHQLLDGVALGDFKMIATAGDELVKLATSETWQLIRSEEYEMLSKDFVRAGEKLVKRAREKNMDGTALAYVEMTLSCVRCHQYVREHRRDARLEPKFWETVPPAFARRSGSKAWPNPNPRPS